MTSNTITPATDHTIKTLDKLPFERRKSGASWHQVTCSCGWTRKYVSHYCAIVMHDKHTRAAAADQEASEQHERKAKVVNISRLIKICLAVVSDTV